MKAAKKAKLERQAQRQQAATRNEFFQLQAERIKKDHEEAPQEKFRLSDEEYAEAVKRKPQFESLNYGPSSVRQKAMRISEKIYIIDNKDLGTVQELVFQSGYASLKYFIMSRFVVCRYEEFKALTKGYKAEELDKHFNPEKKPRGQRRFDIRPMNELGPIDAIKNDSERHKEIMNRAENGQLTREECEEFGIDYEATRN